MDVSHLPTKILICGVPFKIVYKDRIKSDSEELVYGQTFGHERRIEVARSAHDTEEQVRSTLLHECLHAILHVTGQSEGLSDNQEESLVVALENALGPVITQLGVANYVVKKKA